MTEPAPAKRIDGTTAAALITAPGSGQGKSMVTAALARLHRNAGRQVRVFKHGPDFLDPMLQAKASGHPVYNLHPWMTGEAECRWRLAEAAMHADVVLVEGSMGLFDGDPSSADLAVLAGIPALPVINAWGMAQTFGAVALGLDRYRDDVTIHEVIANRIGSPRHGDMLAASMAPGMRLLGAIPRHDALAIPDRHLGIVQAGEIDDLDRQLDAAAEVLAEAGLEQPPATVTLTAEPPAAPPHLLAGWRIGIAHDHAFAFIYPANLDLLRALGAELVFFSPLADESIPEVDALWIPGGYPELHGATLAAGRRTAAELRAFHAAGRPILAECGGLMYCLETLADGDGHEHEMIGILPGRSIMAGKLMALGIQSLDLGAGELRGHTFHHSRLETTLEPVAHTRKQRYDSAGEGIFRHGSLTATYFHSYFPSHPGATASLLTAGAVSG